MEVFGFFFEEYNVIIHNEFDRDNLMNFCDLIKNFVIYISVVILPLLITVYPGLKVKYENVTIITVDFMFCSPTCKIVPLFCEIG